MKISSRGSTSNLSSFEDRLESFYLNYVLFEPVDRAEALLIGFLAGCGIENADVNVEWNHISVTTDNEMFVLLNA
jgi:hypothetical protein